MLTIIKPEKSKPHVISDTEGKRTHYLGEVRMEIAADRPAAEPVKKVEEVKYNV